MSVGIGRSFMTVETTDGRKLGSLGYRVDGRAYNLNAIIEFQEEFLPVRTDRIRCKPP